MKKIALFFVLVATIVTFVTPAFADTWYTGCTVKTVTVQSNGVKLAVQDSSGRNRNYFINTGDATLDNRMLATALTAYSTNKPVHILESGGDWTVIMMYGGGS